MLRYVKYRWRREEEETRQMYDMVERIIGIDARFLCCSLFYLNFTTEQWNEYAESLLCVQMSWGAITRHARRIRTCSLICPFLTYGTLSFRLTTGRTFYRSAALFRHVWFVMINCQTQKIVLPWSSCLENSWLSKLADCCEVSDVYLHSTVGAYFRRIVDELHLL